MKRFGKRKILAVIVATVVLIVLAGVLLMAGSHHSSPKAKSATHTVAVTTTAVIEITPAGFLPSTLSVMPHTNVTWVNEDVMPHLPAADPYPSHSSLPSLVAPRALGQKETYSFLVTKQETIHYHDDLDPILTGVVEVR